MTCVQCIVLTTRPLLYIFFQCRVYQSYSSLMRWMQSQSIRGLLQMCTESARQILRILSVLLNQGLLGEFADVFERHGHIPFPGHEHALL